MTKKEQQFTETVWEFYKNHGRHDLPWRHTTDPYRILVSEIMLQQTQVDRVLPKYIQFIKQWGSARALAQAPLSDVLKAWQGLGYNRRAKFLHQAAKQVVLEKQGEFPHNRSALQDLPGVGHYTAGAIMAFAYNQPVPFVETNIRTVFLHHFFKNATDVADAELVRYIVRTMDEVCPREWYWALMDYGSYLKRTHKKTNVNSKHYTTQSRFEGSDRQIRGAIIRTLLDQSYTVAALTSVLSAYDAGRTKDQLARLVSEGMVVKDRQKYYLPQ